MKSVYCVTVLYCRELKKAIKSKLRGSMNDHERCCEVLFFAL